MATSYTPMGSKAEVKGDDDDDVDLHDPSVFVRPSRKTPKIIFVILLILLLLLAALSVTFIVLYTLRPSPSPSPSPSPDVCQSDACFDLSVQIKGSMNEDVDPCEDFYNFTCGNWDIYNHITQGIWLRMSEVQKPPLMFL